MMEMNKKLIIPIIAAVIVIALIVVLLMVFKGERSGDLMVNKGTCITQTKNAGRKLLEPLYPNNTPLSFETGPECNILGRLKQNSVVLYISPRGPDPITLKVAGLPGDTVEIGSGNTLMINGVEYKNSRGQPYKLNAGNQRTTINRIKTSHGGKLPEGFYFLMGDNDKIYLDSSRFGISDGKDILGILAE